MAIVLGGVVGATTALGARGQGGAATPTVGIAMAHESADPAPGDPVSYAVWLVNNSPTGATGYRVATRLPAAVVNVVWTCRALGLGSACGREYGAGELLDIADVGGHGGAVLYSISATIDGQGELSSFTAAASLKPPSEGACEPCEAGTTIGDIPTVVLSKTYRPRDPDPAPGDAIGFTITLTNDSAADATDYLVGGSSPAELAGVSWTCEATGAGSTCGTRAGTGRLRDVADVGADGGTVVYRLTGTLSRRVRGAPFRQQVTLRPGPGQACVPVATAADAELDYYHSSYGAPPVVTAMTCRVNNVVQPTVVNKQATRSLADTGSLAIPYAMTGLAAIACGGVLVLLARRRRTG